MYACTFTYGVESNREMSVKWLFLDMNSFFASVEQQEQPRLRGRPTAVAPVMTERTCCIAASYEAKRFGVKTGTNVGEARRMCPGLQVVEARPHVYVDYHHRIIEAVDTVLPVEEVCSIDELACRLGNGQREKDQAVSLADSIKSVLRKRIGEFVPCSIGLAPNKFLAKIAGDMQKPDGLTIIEPHDLPEVMFKLKLNDLTGIGPRLLRRLNDCGIRSVEQLYQQDEKSLQSVWHSVVGRQWWYLLRGYDIVQQPSHRKSLGHSHVLPPKFRSEAGARGVLLRLIHKGAARLRREDYWATRMTIHVSFVGNRPAWVAKLRFRPCQDTSTFVELLADEWRSFPRHGIPLKVAFTFTEIISSRCTSQSLLDEDRRRHQIAKAMDAINQKYGVDQLYLAAMHAARTTAPARIAFNYVPDVELEGPTEPDDLIQWESPAAISGNRAITKPGSQQ